MINSIVKGKSYERKIAKKLSNVFGCKFNRVPQSGAFATVNRSDDYRFKGDIFTEDTAFNAKHGVMIECKKCKDAVTIADLCSEKSALAKWVVQSEREAKDARAFWLIFSWNGSADFVMIGVQSPVAVSKVRCIYQWQVDNPQPLSSFLAHWVSEGGSE
jgi:hypothetical protein